jgi:hypothetical protein
MVDKHVVLCCLTGRQTFGWLLPPCLVLILSIRKVEEMSPSTAVPSPDQTENFEFKRVDVFSKLFFLANRKIMIKNLRFDLKASSSSFI